MIKPNHIKKSLVLIGVCTASTALLSSCVENIGSNPVVDAKVAKFKQAYTTSKNTTQPNLINGVNVEYYTHTTQVDPQFVATFRNANLTIQDIDLENIEDKSSLIRSVKIRTYIKPTRTGSYKIAISEINGVTFKIGDKTLAPTIENNKAVVTINLDSNNYYEMLVTINHDNQPVNIKDLQLFLASGNGSLNQIPATNLFTPFSEFGNLSVINITAARDGDSGSNNSCVPNSYKFSGFIAEYNKSTYAVVYKMWMKSYYAKNKTKHFAAINGLAGKTLGTATPWTDCEKVTGFAAQYYGLATDAQNPVLAAYPIIEPILEDVIVSTNDTYSLTNGASDSQTNSHAVTNSKTNETSQNTNIGINLNLSEQPSLGFSASHTWSSSNSTTVSLDDTNSTTKDNNWSTQLSFSNSDRAKFAYVTRFKNTGTATAYDVQFEFQGMLSNGMAIPGINKRDDFAINSLRPDATSSRYNLGYKDAFGSSPLELNAEQFAIWEKKPYITINMPQTDAKIKRVDQNGMLVEYQGVQWDDLIDIAKQHAMLTLRLPNHEHERIIAAIDEDIPISNELPELNLRDALYVAYKIKESAGKYIYYNERSNQKYTFESIHFIIDDFTKTQLNKQLATNPNAKKSPLDSYKLRQGMRVLVAPYGWVYNELTKEYSYAEIKTGFYRNQAAIIDGKPYLFDNNGILIQYQGLQTLTGFQIKPRTYFNLSNGTLHHGWKQIGNSWYYFDDKLNYSAIANNWLDYNGNRYRFDSDGIMLTGLHEIDGYYYYFAANGSMLKNEMVTVDDTTKYYCANDGVCALARMLNSSTRSDIGTTVAAGDNVYLTYDNLRDGVVIDLTGDKVRGGFIPGYNSNSVPMIHGNGQVSYPANNLKEIAIGRSLISVKNINGSNAGSMIFVVDKVNDCGTGKVYGMNSANECDNNMKIRIKPKLEGGALSSIFTEGGSEHITGEFILQARGWKNNYVKNYWVKIDVRKPTTHGTVMVWNGGFIKEYFDVSYIDQNGTNWHSEFEGLMLSDSASVKIPDYASNIHIAAYWSSDLFSNGKGNLFLSLDYPNDEKRDFYLHSFGGGNVRCGFEKEPSSWGRPNSCK